MSQKPLSKTPSANGKYTVNLSPMQVKGLLRKISKKIAVLLRIFPSLLRAAFFLLKILLIKKAIDKPFLSNKPFCILSVIGYIKQHYLIIHFIIFRISNIMKMSGGGTMRNKKYHIYLSDFEYHHIINSLVELKNSLIAQGRYTDAVDDVLCKFVSAKKKSIKIA